MQCTDSLHTYIYTYVHCMYLHTLHLLQLSWICYLVLPYLYLLFFSSPFRSLTHFLFFPSPLDFPPFPFCFFFCCYQIFHSPALQIGNVTKSDNSLKRDNATHTERERERKRKNSSACMCCMCIRVVLGPEQSLSLSLSLPISLALSRCAQWKVNALRCTWTTDFGRSVCGSVWSGQQP